MGTEITKSKISQELHLAATTHESLSFGTKQNLFFTGSKAIDELNQRLIDQTTSGMERGKKDQEEIKRLNRELAQLCAEKSRWQDARKEGREEALNALVRTDPEQFSNEYFYSSIDSHGEFNGEKWNHKELLKLLDLDGDESLYDRLEQETCEQLYKIQDLENELEEVRKETQDFAEGLLACRAGVSAAAQEKDKDVKMRKVENFTALMESLWMKAQYFIAKYPQKEGA